MYSFSWSISPWQCWRRCWSICDYTSVQCAGVSRCPARVHIADHSQTGDDCRGFSSPSHTSRLYQTGKGAADASSGMRPSLHWLFLNRLEFLLLSQASNSKGPRVFLAIFYRRDRQLCACLSSICGCICFLLFSACLCQQYKFSVNSVWTAEEDYRGFCLQRL